MQAPGTTLYQVEEVFQSWEKQTATTGRCYGEGALSDLEPDVDHIYIEHDHLSVQTE